MAPAQEHVTRTVTSDGVGICGWLPCSRAQGFARLRVRAVSDNFLQRDADRFSQRRHGEERGRGDPGSRSCAASPPERDTAAISAVLRGPRACRSRARLAPIRRAYALIAGPLPRLRRLRAGTSYSDCPCLAAARAARTAIRRSWLKAQTKAQVENAKPVHFSVDSAPSCSHPPCCPKRINAKITPLTGSNKRPDRRTRCSGERGGFRSSLPAAFPKSKIHPAPWNAMRKYQIMPSL